MVSNQSVLSKAMPAGIENNVQNHNKTNTVTPVSNDWVICNSKTRPGFKYYFNTLTGRAVWNLSPAEIEKAQMFTTALPSGEIHKCPEPNDTPMNLLQPNPSQVYNKQIASNQFPNQSLNIFPVNLLNSIPGSSGLNQNLWAPNSAAIPQGQVLFVAFPQAMNVQSSQECSQNSQINSYNQFCHSQNSEKNSQSSAFQGNAVIRGMKKFNNWSRHRFPQGNIQNTENWNGKRPDLRQKLIRKRTNTGLQDTECEQDSYEGIVRNEDVQVKPKAPVHCNNMPLESPSKYDLTVLKCLKTPHSQEEHWFIVTDTEIILNNFPFLNKITDPDQNCYIVVPDHVMKELQEIACTSKDVRRRRIYRFLSEHIESEFAFRGDILPQLANDDEKMFATCEHLAMRNNVILLSNNIKLQEYKNTNKNIHVLTMRELRMILEEKSIIQEPIGRSSPTHAMEIVVTNDMQAVHNDHCPSWRKRPQTPRPEVPPRVISQKSNISFETAPSSSKFMVETGVQEKDLLNHFNEIEPNHVPCDAPDSAGFKRGPRDSYLTNNVLQRQIKLSRAFPNQKPNNEENTQKKQYRWRKRKESSSNLTNVSKSTSEICEMAVDNNVKSDKAGTFSARSLDSNITKNMKALFSPQSRSSDGSSISNLFKKTAHPNIIIEETSTSGVISNTNDSESVDSNNKAKEKKGIRMCNYVLFELAGQTMAEALRTRREEWVLRFVQIMEEVLRVKLRENSQNKDYAEPWATDLPELTRCIIKKFSDYFNVVDAANKLSFTLYRLCDDKGNVTPSIEPSQYMDMYSYGVYLIEALKEVANDCEDLNLADESLKKLLYDIQNANLDSSHNDTFVDELHEDEFKISESIGGNNELPQSDVASTKETTDDDLSYTQNNKTSYRLRSRKRHPTKVQYEQQAKFPTNLEESFFSSLELEKRHLVKPFVFQGTADDTPKSANGVKKPTKVQLSPKIPQSPKIAQSVIIPEFPIIPQSHIIPLPPYDSRSPEIRQSPRDPRSPRTPQSPRDPRSPRTLQSLRDPRSPRTPKSPRDPRSPRTTPQGTPMKQLKLRTPLMQDNMPNINDTGTGDERITAPAAVAPAVVRNFSSIPEFENRLSIRFVSDKDEDEEYVDDHYDENEIEDGEITLESDIEGIPNERNLEQYEMDNEKRFRCFVKDFIGEIRESFESVNKLCAEFVQDYKNSQECKPEMDTKLRESCATLLKICNSLNRILDRETTRPENNIMLLLKKAQLEGFVPNEDLRLDYTDIVTKCRNQAFDYYKNVTLIMSGAGIRKSA